ncbi:recombinase family protein [Psychrobacter sp. NG27]|uniref:recombinase family protein n=1 Tax=Psychrobacter sp. NG27 TaxID=2781966 RepID=UPI0018E03C43|nr:recombinase family protein [Psychrobacter sp. NG27]MBI0427570.1 recombinase family protein [Psychrobacter sp. NG27]
MEPLFSVFTFIRTYLRASTKEQDAKHARNELIQFADDHGHKIAAFDVENKSGATLISPQLMQLVGRLSKNAIDLVYYSQNKTVQ